MQGSGGVAGREILVVLSAVLLEMLPLCAHFFPLLHLLHNYGILLPLSSLLSSVALKGFKYLELERLCELQGLTLLSADNQSKIG